MQPIDPADPRKRHTQIAASIRAAILSGELAPDERLPSGEELAQFFGVARATLLMALRTLQQEGFVTSRMGSGVYVRSQANLPVPEGEAHPLTGVAAFLFEMGHLKHTPRSGWLLLGIPQPESVAEHSFRVGMVALALATLENADPMRAAALALFHDGHETRIGDVPSVGRAYVTTADPEAVTSHQTSAMPDTLGKMFADLTAEYEARATPEAQVAKDADKLETLLQAIEYAAQGYDTQAWQATSRDALRTDSAKQLAQAITTTDPHGWYAAFQASYHELRAATRGHQPESS